MMIGKINKILFFCLLFPALLFSQWKYRTSEQDKMPYAYAEILSDTEYDFEFLLWNEKYLGVNFMINSEYFKKGKLYSISFVIDTPSEIKLDEYEVTDGNIRMNSFIDENGEKKDIYDILNRIKNNLGCVITIINNNKKLELFSYSTDSDEAIDFVLKKPQL